MDMLSGLNEEQQAAVLHGQGPLLVLAGAGSGKTRVITSRILHLIRSGQVRPENIYAVTFTNKAADEMKERVFAELPNSDRSGPWVSTFHSLCVRILRQFGDLLGYSRNFTILDTDDQLRTIKACLKDLSIPEKELPPRKVLSLISLSKNSLWNLSEQSNAPQYRADGNRLPRVATEYARRLRQSNSMDFDDLLCNTLALLDRNESVRLHYQRRIQYLLVDEYQDTNLLQHKLMQLLVAEPRNICAVGDEDQSIYSFRGARVDNILTFDRDFHGARIMKLEQNYRSTQRILEAASAVVSHNLERKGKVLWTRNQTGDLLCSFSCPTGYDEARRICRWLQTLRAERPAWTFAVLYRTNSQSRYFEEELRRNYIPFRLVGSLSFYARAEIKDLLAYIRFLRNPADSSALERIINNPPRGIGDSTVDKVKAHAFQHQQSLWDSLQAFARDIALSGRIQKRLQEFVELIAGLQKEVESQPLFQLIQNVGEQTGYLHLLQEENSPEAQSRLGNIDELMAAAREWETQGYSASEFLDRTSLASDTDTYDQKAQVTLMTLHAAKGLEFDAVFLVGMEEGLFPHSQSLSSPSGIEEERRLCYVGMTRARQQLFLSWAVCRRSYSYDSGAAERNLPSRFLHEIPSSLIRAEGDNVSFAEKGDEDADGPDWTKGQREQASRYPANGRGAYAGRTFDTKKGVARFLEDLAARKAGEQIPSREKSAGKPKGDFSPGTRVRHPKFGSGRVVAVEKQASDSKLTVQFDVFGRKKLLLSVSNLVRQ